MVIWREKYTSSIHINLSGKVPIYLPTPFLKDATSGLYNIV